jgi:uncharacterized RDD family membrane protein YckC
MEIRERATCEIVTPEGIPIRFEVATAGDRLAAFATDFALIAAAILALFLLLSLSLLPEASEALVAFSLVAFFLMRNFYFIFFELRGSGTTYGKRRLGLRVIARDGGPLTAEMVFARNLTRDLELFLPLTVLTSPGSLIPQEKGWSVLAGLAWVLAFALLPIFNRKRLRCGDIIAGTMVVVDPRSALLPDLAEEEATQAEESPVDAARYEFSRRQLEVYGIQELQVLEDLFRRREEGRLSEEAMRVVCEKIKKKIDWPREAWRVDALPFLRDFYRAQRAHLEQGLLFGKRKERKSEPRSER